MLRPSVDADEIVPLAPHQALAIRSAPDKPAPNYPDPETRALSERLEAAYTRKRELERGGFSAEDVHAEILELRRQIREGGQLRAGDSLGEGRYLLVDELGRGGFGVVFRAHDEQAEHRLLGELFNAHCGIVFGPATRLTVERRLRERIAALGLRSFSEYYQFLRDDERGRAELDEAIDLLTMSASYFFREIDQIRSYQTGRRASAAQAHRADHPRDPHRRRGLLLLRKASAPQRCVYASAESTALTSSAPRMERSVHRGQRCGSGLACRNAAPLPVLRPSGCAVVL